MFLQGVTVFLFDSKNNYLTNNLLELNLSSVMFSAKIKQDLSLKTVALRWEFELFWYHGLETSKNNPHCPELKKTFMDEWMEFRQLDTNVARLDSFSGVPLIGAFPLWMLAHTQFNPLIWISCQLGFFLLHFGFSYSSALLVIITIEKCFALYFPFKTKTICTVSMARRVSLVTAVIFVAFNSQFFYFAKRKTNERSTYCSYDGPEKYF